WLSEGRRPFLVLPGSAQRVRLQKLLEQHEVQAAIATASLPELLSARERREHRRTRKVSAADVLSSLAELKADDYVVHVDHGIGLYRGLKHLAVADTEGDFLHLEYLGGDRLYLPVDRINL